MIEHILSIKPKWSQAILKGIKTVEFRRKIFKFGDIVYIYESNPTKKIVGGFLVKEIVSGSPQQIWEDYSQNGEIDKKSFFDYFENKSIAHAIIIEETFVFEIPLSGEDFKSGFFPPQNYTVLENVFVPKK